MGEAELKIFTPIESKPLFLANRYLIAGSLELRRAASEYRRMAKVWVSLILLMIRVLRVPSLRTTVTGMAAGFASEA